MYILCFVIFCDFYFCFVCFPFLDFVGVSFVNPDETSLVQLGEPIGLNGLLHTLNATMILTKVSYVLRLVFILFYLRTSKRSVWRYLLGYNLSYFMCLFHRVLARKIINL